MITFAILTSQSYYLKVIFKKNSVHIYVWFNNITHNTVNTLSSHVSSYCLFCTRIDWLQLWNIKMSHIFFFFLVLLLLHSKLPLQHCRLLFLPLKHKLNICLGAVLPFCVKVHCIKIHKVKFYQITEGEMQRGSTTCLVYKTHRISLNCLLIYLQTDMLYVHIFSHFW